MQFGASTPLFGGFEKRDSFFGVPFRIVLLCGNRLTKDLSAVLDGEIACVDEAGRLLFL